MQNINTQISEGWAAHRSGNNEEALRRFEASLAVDNENIDAYYGIGLARRDLRQHNEAIAAFEQALQLTRAKIEMSTPSGSDAGELPDIDRYMMLLRMLDQRIAEVRSLMNV